jgi:UDP-glucose 4-epimerase
MNPENALVTGGAGFIGSALVQELVKQGVKVTVLDNFSAAAGAGVVAELASSGKVKVLRGDCTSQEQVSRALIGIDTVFHLAANPEVRLDRSNAVTCMQQNVFATFNLLEAMKRSSAGAIVFTSSSTVYGEPATIPTPEDYGPLFPISVYGASKLASEALISAYSKSFGMRAAIFRLANIVGEKSGHGVIPDFIAKLARNPNSLEVLGDGSQRKSYLHINDCVDGILKGVLNDENETSIFNLGASDSLPVSNIATIVISALGLSDVEIKYSGGLGDGRGWIGDVKTMLLDITKLSNLGWRPRYSSGDAVEITAEGIAKSKLLGPQHQ